MTRGCVLIVDDNVELAENIAEILEDEGFSCMMAQSAEHALELMSTTRYSLVISDVRMAGMSGVELLRRVGNQTPVVLMTSYARDRIVEEAERHGALEVLRKPLDIEALCELVAHVGGRSRTAFSSTLRP